MKERVNCTSVSCYECKRAKLRYGRLYCRHKKEPYSTVKGFQCKKFRCKEKKQCPMIMCVLCRGGK